MQCPTPFIYLFAAPGGLNCRGIIESTSRLYSYPPRNTFKVGSISQKRRGNIRGFTRYLQRLELTYYLYTLLGDAIITMLSSE